MKKRILLSVVLVAMFASGVFAQTHWISAEASLLGGGVRYEYLINPHFTLGAYFYGNATPLTETINVGFGAAARWYPFARRFFTELGLGYNSQTYYYDDYHQTRGGFSIVPGFGWTIDVGRRGGFFVSPGIKVPITFVSNIYNPLSGTIIYLGLGVAF